MRGKDARDWPPLVAALEDDWRNPAAFDTVWYETVDGHLYHLFAADDAPKGPSSLIRKWCVSVDPTTGLAWTWCRD